MDIKLDQLETEVPEADFLAAEAMLAADAVGRVREPERRLYTALVRDPDGWEYETEARLTPSRLKAASCDCAAFARAGRCAHILALALWLRRRQRETAAKKSAQRQRPEKKPKKSALAALLDQIEPEDLRKFVLDYARRHQNFTIALKARFASGLDGHDSTAYLELLEAAIQSARQVSGEIGIRGVQKISHTLDHLRAHTDRLLTEGAAGAAADILLAVVQKLPPIFRRTTRRESLLREHFLSAVNRLDTLLAGQIAPELRDRIRLTLREEAAKMLLRNLRLDLPLAELLLSRARSQIEREELRGLTDEMLDKYLSEGRSPRPVLQLWREVQEPDSTAALHGLALRQAEVRPAVLQLLLDDHRPEAATELVAELHARRLFPPPLSDYEEQYVQVLANSGRRAAVAELSRLRLQETLEERYYRYLRELVGTSRADVIALLEGLSFSGKKVQFVAARLAAEGAWSDLLDWLERYPLPELLESYAAPLYQALPGRTATFLHRWLPDYLSDHLGRQTSVRIRELLLRLRAAGADELVGELVALARNNYSERDSLMEELSEF